MPRWVMVVVGVYQLPQALLGWRSFGGCAVAFDGGGGGGGGGATQGVHYLVMGTTSVAVQDIRLFVTSLNG